MSDRTHIDKRSMLFVGAACAILAISGCAVGPDFKRPAAPYVSGYTATPLSTVTTTPPTTAASFTNATTTPTTRISGSEAQRFVEGLDIPGQWWTLFHSKSLNDLIERSLKANPNITAAQAALRMAREDVLAQQGAYYPNVSGSFSVSRNKTSVDIAPVPNNNELYYNLYTPQLSVSYAPDVFGLNQRTIESLQAQEQQARFALVATHITLSANVAAAAIQEASLRAQIDATRELVAINTDMLKILRNQFTTGFASRLDVAAQESQLAQVVATLPPLLKQLDQQRDLLAALAGGFPSQELPEKFELSDLQLPQDLPVSLPSKLVEQRPDVRQAEENLHFASAQIGVAAANRLPNITLSADVGTMALTAGRMFAGPTWFGDIGAGLTQPLFDAGTLEHRERAARAAYDQALDQYRGAVITAFQNVADSLHALQQDGDALRAAIDAEDAARVTLDLGKQQLQAGYASYLDLLNAEQAYQQSVITLIQAQTNRYADTAALFLSLGGGWWNRADLPQN
jgi:NodT family efflux transporter outer membrane factor (OMF) lipoprotein